MEGHTNETNRDRVRRLLFDRLGFRLKRGDDAEKHAQGLDRLADDLAYLSDGDLETLRRSMEIAGDGKTRDIWPALSGFRGRAQAINPRPIEELPSLRTWFASVEGPRARAEGTLVETADFFIRRRRPPVSHGEMATVIEAARVNRRRLELLSDRERGGWDITPGDAAWREHYRERLAKLEQMINDLAAQKRGAA